MDWSWIGNFWYRIFPMLTVQTALIGHTPRCQASFFLLQLFMSSMPNKLSVYLFNYDVNWCCCVWPVLTEVSWCQYWVLLKGNVKCQVFLWGREWVPTPAYCVLARRFPPSLSIRAVLSCDFHLKDLTYKELLMPNTMTQSTRRKIHHRLSHNIFHYYSTKPHNTSAFVLKVHS